MKLPPNEQLIIALDVDKESVALELVDELKEYCVTFKIGAQLFTKCGPKIVEKIHHKGCQVFLDMKYHDIPNTVAGAIRAAVDMDVFMCTIHVSGGTKMMQAALEARGDRLTPKLIGVTVLTSMDQPMLEEVGVMKTLEMQSNLLVNLAQKAGIDGVVASPQEVFRIRQTVDKNFIIVTPGIRPEIVADDQKRVATPKEAIRLGANFLVVGRPVICAPSPIKAAEQITREMWEAK
ncbi:orotidine-5'-phosphate decarboxylase [bacterium]|nr:orotidine-5'-phosphate decarboxylase [bacterium]MBU1753503.1 orotidine-5'-phosphate decarboxylase [bacterium]